VQFSWALDGYGGHHRVDRRVQRFDRNMLCAMIGGGAVACTT
jgi:hypothetical protein